MKDPSELDPEHWRAAIDHHRARAERAEEKLRDVRAWVERQRPSRALDELQDILEAR